MDAAARVAGGLVAGVVLAASIGGATGCATAGRQNLYAANPLDRARAAVAAAERCDAGAVFKVVDLLEDPDAGVRLYAILALQRLTCRDYGYRYYANPAERAAAVERWRAALRAGEVQSGTPTALQISRDGREEGAGR
jgi:hypothetical protein